MKYKVIGWTHYDDGYYPEGECSPAAFRAIIDHVRAHGYDFSGYAHQELFDCTPVMNNGERMCFTQRAWGRIMAEAHGHFGVYDYTNYSIGYDAEKTPEYYTIDESEILPKEELCETYNISLSADCFEKVLKEKSLILTDSENLRYIDVGDTVILESEADRAEYKVSGVIRGRDKNGGLGAIDFVSGDELERAVYMHDSWREEALQLYEHGAKAVKLNLE